MQRLSKLWTAPLLAISLAACGDDADDGSGSAENGAGNGAGSETGLPNSCALFTEADTAPYGGLGEGRQTSTSAIDLCIYTATIDGEIRQVSVAVGVEASFAPGVDDYDELYADGTKTTAEYGEESYVYVTDTSTIVMVRQPPYSVIVSVRLMQGAEAAAHDVTEQLLAQL